MIIDYYWKLVNSFTTVSLPLDLKWYAIYKHYILRRIAHGEQCEYDPQARCINIDDGCQHCRHPFNKRSDDLND